MEIDERGRPIRRRPAPGTRPAERVGFPEFEHNQWTFEGQIERLGVFARSVSGASGVRRVLGVLLALLILFPFVTGLIVLVFVLVT